MHKIPGKMLRCKYLNTAVFQPFEHEFSRSRLWRYVTATLHVDVFISSAKKGKRDNNRARRTMRAHGANENQLSFST